MTPPPPRRRRGPPPASAGPLPFAERARAAARAGAAAALLAGGLHLLQTRTLYAPGLLGSSALSARVALVALAVASQLAPPRHQKALLAAACVALVPLLLGPAGILLLAYAAVVLGLARFRERLLLRAGVAFALWAVVPLARWTLPPGTLPLDPPLLAAWVGLAYSTLLLLVEHRRGEPAKLDLADDVFYLTALPRLVTPFFQPISPGLVKLATRPVDGRFFRRIVGLSLYGLALLLLAGLRQKVTVPASPWVRFPVDFLSYYAMAASHIFVAVAAFQCLGFDLPSGFRRPFLARSFADFFRRWNHYVRDAVVSLFYFPLVGLLRRRLSHRATGIVAAYLSILGGSFLLNDFLVPVATSDDLRAALARATDPVHLVMLAIFWSAIILPGQGLLGGPQESARRRRMAERTFEPAATARFLALYVGLFAAAWVVKHLVLR